MTTICPKGINFAARKTLSERDVWDSGNSKRYLAEDEETVAAVPAFHEIASE